MTYFSFRMSYKPTVLATAASTQVTSTGTHVGTAQLGEDPLPWLYQYPGILQPTPSLAVSAEGKGVVTSSPEIDGVTRSSTTSRKLTRKTLSKFRTRTTKSRYPRPKLPTKNRRRGY